MSKHDPTNDDEKVLCRNCRHTYYDHTSGLYSCDYRANCDAAACGCGRWEPMENPHYKVKVDQRKALQTAVAALRMYGWHTTECTKWQSNPGGPSERYCDCGFIAAMKAVESTLL